MAGRVIVGVDNCLAGLHALRRAVAEARDRGATLYAVRCWTTGAGAVSAGAALRKTELLDLAALEVNDALCAAMGGPPRDVPLCVVAPEGPIGLSLVQLADRDDDLLVVGDCQRRGLRYPFSGTVAKYCIRHAICPVLVVPPPALARVSRDVSDEMRRLTEAA